MADLTDLIQSQLSGALLDQLTSNIGSSNKQQTQTAAQDAISVLLNGLARNATKPGGASALGSALDRDHDGSILDDVIGMIGGAAQPKQPKALDGAGILGHILGANQSGVLDMLTKKNGMNKNQNLGMLIKLAPVLMGILGKMKKTNQIDTNGLPDILSGAANKMNKKAPGGNILGSLLDQDGDGNLNNEIKKVGFSLLRSIFKR